MTAGVDRADAVWVGIDLGTQSVRALAVTDGGGVFGSGSRPLDSRRDGSVHEQDPEQWWRAVGGACTQALRDSRSGQVRGLAVSATSGSVLLMDRQGRPLTTALMYDDTRAAGEVAEVNEAGRDVWNELGYRRMQAAWALPKLLWLLRRHPDLVADARLAHQSDFVNRRLVGSDVPTDLSNALKTGAHLVDETWPDDVLEKLRVPAHVLPGLVRSGTLIGTVCARAAESTGVPVGTPVVAGMTDGCAAQLGAGVVRQGSWNSVLGTTLVVKGVTETMLRDPRGVVYSHKAPDGHWLPGGASSTGAGVISRDFAGRDLDALDRLASPYEPVGVLAYPLVSKGERFPFVAPAAEAFVVGEPRDEGERYAAILHGVGYVERLCFDYLDLLGASVDGDLVLTGGATRSEHWSQLRADILGRPVTLTENAEPALGMAVLAASRGRRTLDAAADMVRVRETRDPSPGSAGRHDDAYLRLVQELEQRGWLQPAVAAHARTRSAR